MEANGSRAHPDSVVTAVAGSGGTGSGAASRRYGISSAHREARLSGRATFTGTSFQLDGAGEPLLVFGPGVYSVKVRNDPNAVGEAAMFSHNCHSC